MRNPLRGRTALYRIYDSADVLLYVGIASNFGQRWQQHGRQQPWWNRVHRQTVTWYETRADAHAAEVEAIRTEKPAFNILHRPRPPKPREPKPILITFPPEWERC